MKLLGGLLIMSAAAACVIKEQQREMRDRQMLEEMLCALGAMECAVRFRRISMPQILEEQAARPVCGGYFKMAVDFLKSGITLQSAWKMAFDGFCVSEGRDVLTRLEFSGDEQRLTENLRLCQERLRRVLGGMEREARNRGRLLAACALSGGGLLVILLL